MEAEYVFLKMSARFLLICCIVVALSSNFANAKDEKDDPYASLKKKSVVDYTDADLERLFDQWEEGDEPLEDDELPEWKRPRPKVDLSNVDPNDPESMLKLTKKGQTLMMFASISGNPSEAETEQISLIWATSLFNAQYELQRYVVGSNRVLFTVKDGFKAWEIKDFLIQQDRCELVTIEGKDYYGKGSENYVEPEKKEKKKKTDSNEIKGKKKSKEEVLENVRKNGVKLKKKEEL